MKTRSKFLFNLFMLFVLTLSLLGGAVNVTPAYAVADIVVNTSADELDGNTPNGSCSLREAIVNINESNPTNTDCGYSANTISFDDDYTITLTSQLTVNSSIIINGNGRTNTIIQANAAANTATDRVFYVRSSASLTLNSLTIRNGFCNGGATCTDPDGYGSGGGGILNLGILTITNSSVSDNRAQSNGGGIYSSNTLNITNSTLSNNSTTDLTTGTGGGGIANFVTANITNSTFSSNAAGNRGGGIKNIGTITITNSTFSANTAANTGGGIRNDGNITVTNSTIAGNTGSGGGGGIATLGSSANLYNTIIANNTVGNCSIGGTYAIGATNLATDATCDSATQKTAGEISLGALADNGGATQTMALGVSSSAIDAGDSSKCSAAVGGATYGAGGLDQRDAPRPTLCDVGAYEYHAPQTASPFVVTKQADENNNICEVGNCSLRGAITAANDLVGADVITLPAGTYTLTRTGTGENFNATGDLDVRESLTLNGAGSGTTIIRAGTNNTNGIDRVMQMFADVSLTISDVTIANGKILTDQGGGIENTWASGNLTVTRSIFSGNSAAWGGGIDNYGTLIVTDSAFLMNTSANGGGAIMNSGSTAVISGSTFSGGSARDGGGIKNSSALSLIVTNSTFSDNTGSVGAGGIDNDGTLTVTNSTFSGNTNLAIYSSSVATLYLKNSILVNDVNGQDCMNNGGTVSASINNMIESNVDSPSNCGTSLAFTSGAFDGLTLANNGGYTQTMAIDADSPAANAGGNVACAISASSPTYGPGGFDQRGEERPAIGCDIGAYEYQPDSQTGSTFTVTKTDDIGNFCEVTNCSVRQAITAANDHAGADVINIPAGTYTLAIPGKGEDFNVIGDLDITDDVTITGAGSDSTAIDADYIDRVFHVIGAADMVVSISKVTITNGYPGADWAGGIYGENHGTLNVTDSLLSNNTAYYGGGITKIYGTLNFTNSILDLNSAYQSGGGIFNRQGTVNITNSTLSNNTVSGLGSPQGGGLYNYYAVANITNSTLTDNHADNDGGALYNQGAGDATYHVIRLRNSLISGNTTNGNGGGIENYGGLLDVSNSTFVNNYANGSIGGGIYGNINTDDVIHYPGWLYLTNNTFSGNSADNGNGGALYNKGNLYFKNNILANSAYSTDCYNDSGSILANANNLIENNAGGAPCSTPAFTADPKLGVLKDNSGPTWTMMPGAKSIVFNAGNGAACTAAVGAPNYGAGGLDQRDVPRSSICDIGAVEQGSLFKSVGNNDGWTLESKETSNIANTKMNIGNLRVGDDAKNRQYRSLLYFDIAHIPNNAVISKAIVKIKKSSVTVDDPFATLGNLVADMKKGNFGLAALENGDFSALAAPINTAGKFNPSTPPDDWYTLTISPANFKYINLTGATQFRVRFTKDDNNDKGADFITFYGDDSGADAPLFIVEYSVP